MINRLLDIKKIREKKNLTQEEMAELLGVSRKTIANYEAGGNIPDTKEKIFTKILSSYTQEEINADSLAFEGIYIQCTTTLNKE